MHIKPIVAITMGDGAGVGPEIIVKALNDEKVYEKTKPVMIGDKERLKQALRICGLENILHIRELSEGEIKQAQYVYGEIACLDMKLLPADLPFGKLSAAAGDAAYRYVEKAVRLTQAGNAHGICTAPLNKEALHMGGHNYVSN